MHLVTPSITPTKARLPYCCLLVLNQAPEGALAGQTCPSPCTWMCGRQGRACAPRLPAAPWTCWALAWARRPFGAAGESCVLFSVCGRPVAARHWPCCPAGPPLQAAAWRQAQHSRGRASLAWGSPGSVPAQTSCKHRKPFSGLKLRLRRLPWTQQNCDSPQDHLVKGKQLKGHAGIEKKSQSRRCRAMGTLEGCSRWWRRGRGWSGVGNAGASRDG